MKGTLGVFGMRGGGGRRSAAREVTPLTAVYTTVTRSMAAELVDVCCTGARLRCQYVPRKNEELLVSVGTVRAFGTVAWSRRNECGVWFECPLTEEDVQQLRDKAREGRGMTLDAKEALDAWTLGTAR